MIKTTAIKPLKKKIRETILKSKISCLDCNKQFTEEELEAGNYLFVSGGGVKWITDSPAPYFKAIEKKLVKHKTH